MIALEVDNATLRKAIEIRMSDVFPAMSIANQIGGSPSDEWKIIRKESLTEMIAEALDRGLPVREFKCSVTEKSFTECRIYLRVRESIGGRADFP